MARVRYGSVFRKPKGIPKYGKVGILRISGDSNRSTMYKSSRKRESVRNMSSIDLDFDFQTLLGKKLHVSRASWGENAEKLFLELRYVI